MHSWRVLILPYIEEHALYDRYDFDEPWDGPNNSLLLKERPIVYACPSHGYDGDYLGDHFSNYVLVTGRGTVFSSDQGVELDAITDGPGRTLIATDVNQRSVPWTAPNDISADDFVAMFGNDHPTKENEPNHEGQLVIVGFADARVRPVSLAADPTTIRGLVTMAGGEALDSTGRTRDNDAEQADEREPE